MDVSVLLVMSGLLIIGLAAGFLMHRSDFCLAGAFRDVFMFRSYKRIRPLVLMVSLSAFLFEFFRALGILPIYPFPWFAPPAWSNILGGILFGLGMVLAGGCVVGVLYKMGSGNLMAMVAFLGLLAGSALYAEIHISWISLLNQSDFSTKAVTLPQWLGVPESLPIIILVSVCSFWCWRWWKAGLWANRNVAEGYIPLWLTAIGLAALGVLTVFLSGVPMGVTTSYAKAAALLESWVIPGHVANVPYFTATSVQYALPIDDVLRSGGAGPHFDVVAIVQVPLILGIVFGAWLSAQLLGEFQLVWKVPFHQVVMVFTGGIIMAFGARMTPGCNVWHLWGGLPLLTMQSLLFVVGLVPGAWLGGQALQRVLSQGASGSSDS